MAQFTNQAQLSYNGRTVISNLVVGEISSPVNGQKMAVIDTYGAGDTVTYVISATNSSATTASNISITDDLGAYNFGTMTLRPLDYVDGSVLLYVNGVPAAAPTVTVGDDLTFSGITIPVGGNITLIYVARANEYAPLDAQGSIVNTASIAGEGCTPIIVSETVTPEEEANLGIVKSVDPVTVNCGDRVNYTFNVSNYGNTAADGTSGIVITDSFAPVLGDIAVSLNGVSWTEGVEYTYDETTGLFTTTPGAITVPAATFSQDITTGQITVTPAEVTLTVSGTV